MEKEFFYSASTGGFYLKEIHGDNIPSDAKPITEERWKELLDEQSAGKQIVPDENGLPIAVVPAVDNEAVWNNERLNAVKEVDSISPVKFYGLTEAQRNQLSAYRAELVAAEYPDVLPEKPAILTSL